MQNIRIGVRGCSSILTHTKRLTYLQTISSVLLEYILATSERIGALEKNQPSVQWVPRHLLFKCLEVKRR
jgi:hypothetical protein